MQLLNLQVKNFGIFKDFSCEFQPGLNLIRGPNGSGKTTLLEAINYCLYLGPLADRNLLLHTGSGSAALVLSFRDGETNYQIRRTFSADMSKCQLMRDNKVVANGVNDSKRYLQPMLGKESVSITWYLRQQDVTRFADMFVSESSTNVLSRLLGFQHTYAELRSEFNKLLDQKEGDDARVKQRSVQLALSLVEEEAAKLPTFAVGALQLQRTQLEARKGEVSEQIPKARQYELYCKAAEGLAGYQEQLSQLQQQIATFQTARGELVAYEKVLAANGLPANFAAAKSVLYTIQTAWKTFNDAQLMLQELRHQIFEQFRPRPLTVRAKLQACKTELDVISSKLKEYHALGVQDKEIKPNSKCPFCWQTLTEEYLEHIRIEYQNLKEKYREKLANYTQLKECADGRDRCVRNLRTLLKSYKQIRKSAVQPTLNLEFVSAFLTKIDEVERNLVRVDETLRMLEESSQDIQQKIANLQYTIQNFSISPGEVYPNVYELTEELNKLNTECLQLDMQLQEATRIEKRRVELAEKQSQLKEELAQIEYKVGFRNFCEAFIEKFIECGKIALRKSLLENGILQMANSLLKYLSCPYELELSDDGIFYANFNLVGQLPLNRLSYGQRVLLSMILAFIFYCYTNANAVLLADEPTSGLDLRNVENLTRLFESIHKLYLRFDSQCILVTHADISGDFNTIQLEEFSNV